MGEQRVNTGDFAAYLQSIVHLDALDTITQQLDRELTDSQNVMKEIKTMYDTVSTVENTDVSKFLEAGVPNLLMPDMSADNMDVDIDHCIALLKTHAENLKNNFVAPEAHPPKPKDYVKLDLEQYAQSLDQLSKRVAKIKLNKKDELNSRNIELESKLTQLCDDVNKFTAMVQAKTAISESNKNWQQYDTTALPYDSIINKLLSRVNEVSYLLQNKN